MIKSYLFIVTQLPLKNIQAQESQELILATASFNQKVSLLFIDQGIFQILKNQSPAHMWRKDFIQTFKALDLYEITTIYVSKQTLDKYQISTHQLLLPVNIIESNHINSITSQYDIVLTL